VEESSEEEEGEEEDEEEEEVENDDPEGRLVLRQVSEGGDGPSRVTENHAVNDTQPGGSTVTITSTRKVWLCGPSKLPKRPYAHKNMLIRPVGEKYVVISTHPI
jgi:hypothetical protein